MRRKWIFMAPLAILAMLLFTFIGGEIGIRENLTAAPIVLPPHRVVEIAIVAHRRPDGVDHGQAVPRGRNNTLRMSVHF